MKKIQDSAPRRGEETQRVDAEGLLVVPAHRDQVRFWNDQEVLSFQFSAGGHGDLTRRRGDAETGLGIKSKSRKRRIFGCGTQASGLWSQARRGEATSSLRPASPGWVPDRGRNVSLRSGRLVPKIEEIHREESKNVKGNKRSADREWRERKISRGGAETRRQNLDCGHVSGEWQRAEDRLGDSLGRDEGEGEGFSTKARGQGESRFNRRADL